VDRLVGVDPQWAVALGDNPDHATIVVISDVDILRMSSRS